MTRFLHIAVSFAIVSSAYWAYALVAVPWIEPSIDIGPSGLPPGSTKPVSLRAKEFAGMFEEGAWELKNPKVLENDRITLLMQDYRNLGDGRVELHPCTIIIWPDESVVEDEQRKRESVILQAPEGAMLEFDKPLNLASVEIGRLVGGRLKGRITLRSEGKLPGPDDNLWIVTRDVELTEQHVWTSHAVDFRYGRHYGRGQQLHMKLILNESKKGADHRSPNIAGVELFEMARIEKLHLELGKTPKEPKAMPGSKRPPAQAALKPQDTMTDLPIEVICKGPFRFNVPAKLATFEDQVDLMRIHPTGPVDQISCERLSLFLADRGKAGPGKKPKAKVPDNPAAAFDLQPQRIIAQGAPVIVSAPSERLDARGQRLEYDLVAERIVLDGFGEVMLRQGANEIHSQSLMYQSAGPGRLGRIEAKGPGRLRGQMDDKPNEKLEAHWTDMLNVRPDKKTQKISLTGGAGLKYSGFGQLDAREIHFWLTELPPKTEGGQSELLPDRMLARDRVRVASPELSCAVEQLEVWFEQQGGKPDNKSEGKATTAAKTAQNPRTPAHRTKNATRSGQPANPLRQAIIGPKPGAATRPPTHRDAASGQSVAGTAVEQPSGDAASRDITPPPKPPIPQQHFEIVGRLLQARVIMRENEESELSELIVEGGVQFVETQTAKPDEQPLRVYGDRLHVVDAGLPHAAVTVTGKPAHFDGRGLGLTGPSINLNRGTNQLLIEGPGRMDLPMNRDLEGRPLARPGVMTVQWHKRMDFDGRNARFEESVTAVGPSQQLQTETLEVRFREPIRFADDKIEQEPEIEQILCWGGVLMENRTVEQQKQTSLDRIQVVDLAVNLISGDTTAGGPGWVTSVRIGTDNFSDSPSEAPREQLRCLHVRFQGSITGNLHHRELTFRDRVQAAYGPADGWGTTLDVNDPDSLGPGGAVMRCDRLTVTQMTAPTANRRSIELEATGNTVVEGDSYTARAARMTYAEAKDLLVFEGDGRNHAELFRQQQVGGSLSKVTARKILFWPKTKRVTVHGARSLDLDRVPIGRLKNE